MSAIARRPQALRVYICNRDVLPWRGPRHGGPISWGGLDFRALPLTKGDLAVATRVSRAPVNLGRRR